MNDAGWFDSGTTKVRPDWIDYNGHMNVGYYLVAFDIATEEVCVHLGVGEAYRRANDASIFVLEAHVTYDREVIEGAPLAFRSRIVDRDAKRFHLIHHMYHAEDGFLAATNELMCMHMDLTTKRSAPLPDQAAARLDTLFEAHQAAGELDGVGRKIGIRRKT
ncbi:MAG: thioesterase family protein [Thalassobaculaceae bacterium]|nr:thioesterase family protein [Thalassobaculaceae bacterium]